VSVSISAAHRLKATEERVAADVATLPRVRDRHLRAAEAWDTMAEHVELTDERSKTSAEGYVKSAYQKARSEQSER
jgi:hypothetical protein